jgi:hypothetical protein
MSRPANASPDSSDIPGIGPETAPPAPVRRHALGWPAGSVRALLTLGLLGIQGIIVGLEKERVREVQTIYVYLWFMLFLAIASFFAAHGKSMGVPHVHGIHPLGLPRGSIRILLILGFGGIVGWLYHTHRLLDEQPTMPMELMLLMPGGFFLGWLLSRLVLGLSGGEQEPYWFQDLEAWVAIVALLLMLVDVLFHVFINPSMSEESRVSLSVLEGALAAIVSFYFGARS